MGVDDNIYDKIQEYLGTPSTHINVLEENIDSDTQYEYFESSRNFSVLRTEKEIIEDKEALFDKSSPLEDKKNILLELASLKNIEAYRTIENYLNQPEIKLYDWACLALQESRLQLESHLLDESKVLITTGLGGKGFHLRYFVVLFTPNGKSLNEMQKRIIEKELRFFLEKNGSILEDIVFDGGFTSVLSMIPLNVSPKPIFKSVISECNIFGNFLFNDFIITNMKALGTEDIRELLTVNNIY